MLTGFIFETLYEHYFAGTISKLHGMGISTDGEGNGSSWDVKACWGGLFVYYALPRSTI